MMRVDEMRYLHTAREDFQRLRVEHAEARDKDRCSDETRRLAGLLHERNARTRALREKQRAELLAHKEIW